MKRESDALVGELFSVALQTRIAQDVARGMEALTTVLKGLHFCLYVCVFFVGLGKFVLNTND
jgi:hypothetical protein